MCRCFCSFFSKTRIHHKQVNNSWWSQTLCKSIQIPNLKYTTPKEQTYHSKYQIHFPKYQIHFPQYQNRPTKIQHQCIQNTKFSHLKPILGCEIHLRDGVLAKLHNRQRSFYWRTRTNVRIGEWNVLSADKTLPSNCENMNKEQMVIWRQSALFTLYKV